MNVLRVPPKNEGKIPLSSGVGWKVVVVRENDKAAAQQQTATHAVA